MGIKSSTISTLVIVIVLITTEIQVSKGVKCQVGLLTWCYMAMKSPLIQPTAECCNTVRAQEPCFCEFSKYPLTEWWVDSIGARRVQALCSVKFDPDQCK